MAGAGWHYIKHNKNTETPSHCIFFDCESRPDKRVKKETRHILTFGWACYVRRTIDNKWTKPKWLRFEKAEQLYDFISEHAKPKRKLYTFCHNTSFDLPLTDVFGNMKEQGFMLTGAVIDAPPTILTFKRDGAKVVMLDSLNIMRMALASIGAMIGLEKLAMPKPSASRKAWDIYGKRDTEILMLAMLRWFDFLKVNDLGGFAPTLAGQSMRSYRHRFMPDKILVDRHPFATPLAREGYYGGRVECFKLGEVKGPLFSLDINSMFPACMASERYPVKLRRYTKVCDHAYLEKALRDHAAMARVILSTDEPVYPKRHDGRLVFPVGEFETVLSTPELAYALEHGHIDTVKAVATYDTANIFTDFVEYFYTERRAAAQAGDGVSAFMYKILMNSLYGKFGQRGAVWEPSQQTKDTSSKSWTIIDFATGRHIKYRQLGGLLQIQSGEAEARDSVPAIAAHVTAYARMLLWSLIKEAGNKNVFYVDTDSLFVNKAGKNRLARLINAGALGYLKLEGEYNDAEIWGPKDYRFGTKAKTKGVKKSAIWTGKNTIKQEQWSSLRGLVATGSVTSPITRSVTKTLKREYKKGTVQRCGRVSPLTMSLKG